MTRITIHRFLNLTNEEIVKLESLGLDIKDCQEAERILTSIWSETTSSEEDYLDQTKKGRNKSYGQCAVTALVFQDYISSYYDLPHEVTNEIVWANVEHKDKNISHYFNELSKDVQIDLTHSQFPEAHVSWGIERVTSPRVKILFLSTRDYILDFVKTDMRYKQLKERFDELYAKHEMNFFMKVSASEFAKFYQKEEKNDKNDKAD